VNCLALPFVEIQAGAGNSSLLFQCQFRGIFIDKETINSSYYSKERFMQTKKYEYAFKTGDWAFI